MSVFVNNMNKIDSYCAGVSVGRDFTIHGREASPSAGVIDSQCVKTTESGGPSGYDAGKKIKGRKRHILTDTEGNLVYAVIHTADILDRDGAPLLLAEDIHRFPWLRHLFADGGYPAWLLRRDAALAVACVSYAQPLGEGFRSDWGAQIHAGYRSVTGTARLTGKPAMAAMAAIRDLIDGNFAAP